MSYILNSDGKSELLDASYIIVPQNDSLFAIVKNNNVTDLKELTIEEFLTSELKETDCLLMYSAKEKKIKAVNIPRNNAEYLVLKDNKWVWEAIYLHQHYIVPIDIEGIYRMMIRGYEHRKDESKRGFVNENEDAIKYFTSYVKRLEK